MSKKTKAGKTKPTKKAYKTSLQPLYTYTTPTLKAWVASRAKSSNVSMTGFINQLILDAKNRPSV